MARITAFLYCPCCINILQAYLSSCLSSKSKLKFMSTQRQVFCRHAVSQVRTRRFISTYKLAQMQTRNLATILHLGCLTTSPGLTRSSGQSILLEPGKWFAFSSKKPQRARNGIHKNELGTLRRDIWKRARTPTTRHMETSSEP